MIQYCDACNGKMIERINHVGGKKFCSVYCMPIPEPKKVIEFDRNRTTKTDMTYSQRAHLAAWTQKQGLSS